MLPADIDLMVEFLGREDSDVRRLLKAYVRNPKMAGTVRALLKRRCKRAGYDADDPPVFWPVRSLPSGLVNVGKVLQGILPGPRFDLPQEILTQHVGILGHNGTGKSFLAMHIVSEVIRARQVAWVLDIEDEYSRLTPTLPAGALLAL